MSTSSTGELLALAERMRGYVQARGGPAKDDDGKYIGTCWPMILEAADVLDRLAATPKAGVDREVIARTLEGIILRRMHEKRIEGYTLEMSRELADALPSVLGGVDQPRSASEPLGLEAMRDCTGPSEANSPAAPVAWSDERLAELVQLIDWDTGLTIADEVRQLREVFKLAVLPAPVDAGVREALIDALAGLKYIEPAIPVLRTMFMTADLALGARKAEEMDASNKEAVKKLEAVLAALASPSLTAGAVIAWAYEWNDILDYWRPAVVANLPVGKNPPTKHHGKPVRNVRALYAAPATLIEQSDSEKT